jgi:hypothetical protein
MKLKEVNELYEYQKKGGIIQILGIHEDKWFDLNHDLMDHWQEYGTLSRCQYRKKPQK